jgi:hypothetical protein
MILGFLFPSNYLGALCLGIVWIFFEECLSKKKVSVDLIVQHFKDYKNEWHETKQIKFMDLSINMGGYYIGNKLRGLSPL